MLSTFRPELEEGSYELWQVINSKRPFSHTVEGCLATRAALEKASRLRVTGLLANSHLIQETTPEAVLEGWELTHELATITGLPIRCVAVMAELADAPQLGIIDAPLIRLERYMLPPWLVRSAGNDPAGSRRERLPAGRPRPIGQPPTIRTPLSPGEDHVDRD
ncbi:MAG: hypothetical protein JSV80_05980 [Acidobacteriota bacterium]|nr:MAG: hypothetical protein JSV80_05980 [Acidobacteriota bacterium]